MPIDRRAPIATSTCSTDERCPLCASVGSTHAFRTTDRNRCTSRESFEYRRCKQCATIFLTEAPADLGRYYPDDYHGRLSAEQLGAAARVERPKLDLVSPFATDGRLIEIGPGVGGFALAAKQAGFDVTGIEVDRSCCESLEAVGVPAVCTDDPAQALSALEPARVIAMWHVLEHLREPGCVLNEAAALLEPGGVLAIAMPNPESLQFRLLRSRWAHIDAPRHLTLIPYTTLREALIPVGLRPRLIVCDDPFGRYWNTFGWHRAIRSVIGREWLSWRLGEGVARLLAPWEQRGMRGATYTAIFTKDDQVQ